ncbi:MAG: VOC family protein [Proteobacteria bacterium]|nr:VOC family protein [Pseudomonadota bacterium]
MYVPPGFNTITPYFIVADAARFIAFLIEAFGGEETLRHLRPDGRIGNSMVRIGTTTIMVSDECEGYPPMPGSFYLYVEDADQSMARAIAAGGTQVMAVADKPYGDRQGGVRDRHGNLWWISQRLVQEPYSL